MLFCYSSVFFNCLLKIFLYSFFSQFLLVLIYTIFSPSHFNSVMYVFMSYFSVVSFFHFYECFLFSCSPLTKHFTITQKTSLPKTLKCNISVQRLHGLPDHTIHLSILPCVCPSYHTYAYLTIHMPILPYICLSYHTSYISYHISAHLTIHNAYLTIHLDHYSSLQTSLHLTTLVSISYLPLHFGTPVHFLCCALESPFLCLR